MPQVDACLATFKPGKLIISNNRLLLMVNLNVYLYVYDQENARMRTLAWICLRIYLLKANFTQRKRKKIAEYLFFIQYKQLV